MQASTKKFSALTILSAGALLLGACSSHPDDWPVQVSSSSAFVEGVPGGMQSQTVRLTATVVAIDYEKRKVLLADEQGKQRTLNIDPAARNFEKIKSGDRIKVTFVEELIVGLREKGGLHEDSVTGLVATADKEDGHNLLASSSVELNAIVRAIDLTNHTATLQFADGTLRVVTVRADVELNEQQLGREVVFQVNEAAALAIETP